MSPAKRKLACLSVSAVALAALALAGCGGASQPVAHVQLHMQAPADGTRILARSIAVSGSVSPAGASVLVLGRSVAVTGGSFRAQVPLKPGDNLVDVLAGAPHAQDAMSFVRVFRELPVTIPDVGGESPSTAERQLESLGLVASVSDHEGGLDFLLPIPRQVCVTSPAAGQDVAPGSSVQVTVSKLC
jgi:Glucodextranase, domain B/PASTA domain